MHDGKEYRSKVQVTQYSDTIQYRAFKNQRGRDLSTTARFLMTFERVSAFLISSGERDPTAVLYPPPHGPAAPLAPYYV